MGSSQATPLCIKTRPLAKDTAEGSSIPTDRQTSRSTAAGLGSSRPCHPRRGQADWHHRQQHVHQREAEHVALCQANPKCRRSGRSPSPHTAKRCVSRAPTRAPGYRTPSPNTMATEKAVKPQKQAIAPAAPRIWAVMNTASLTFVAPGTNCDNADSDRNCLLSSQPSLLHDLPPRPSGEAAEGSSYRWPRS
jgi:hypothetical protein